jgi:rRNA-processing protein EBP2
LQLRNALATGKLKPGLNIVQDDDDDAPIPKINDEAKMKEKLQEIYLTLPWIERLDMTNDLAPLAPELAVQIERQEQKRASLFKGNQKLPYVAPSKDAVLNDFKREILFYRQAQQAAQEGIKKLQEAGVSTKRPDDYFAEMAKTDDHMQKIRSHLLAKQEGIAKSERIRQIREQRRMGKILQKEVTKKREEEKKKMLDNLKEFRKGKLKNLDFLDDDERPMNRGGVKNRGKGKAGGKKIVSHNRKFRDDKYGFGGKKRGLKRNTADSAGEIDAGGKGGKNRRIGMKKGGGGGGKKGGAGKKAGGARMGKSARTKSRNK